MYSFCTVCQEIRREVWGFKENVITFLDDELIGGHEEFLKWASENYAYRDFRSDSSVIDQIHL